MTEYHMHGVNLSKGQAKKVLQAHKKGNSISIRLSKHDLNGDFKLPLTKTQLNKIQKTQTGMDLKLSIAQLEHMEKTGGFLPLLALIPLITGALGAAGGIAGGVASAVSFSRANAEQAKPNKAIEEAMKNGTGVVSDVVAKVPVIGSLLAPLLQKIGLGMGDINKINRGSCVCQNGVDIKRYGDGLYLGPQGTGLFLGPKR